MKVPSRSPGRPRLIRLTINRNRQIILFSFILISLACQLPVLATQGGGYQPGSFGGSICRTVQVQPQPATATVPDFGSDGLKDLTAEQKKKIFSGEVILVSSHEGAPEGRTIISAALIFEVPAEKAWSILSDTERQAEYLEEIKELKIIEQGADYNRMFFVVRIMGQKVRYTVIHHFWPDKLYFWWELDPAEPRDLKELYGFWKLHRLDEQRTVARYGSLVRPAFPVPGFIRDWLYKANLRSSLEKVKKYVASQSRP
ncbi:MAG TPA: hypothetical protein DCR87_02845 [Acidobacteria bacterium]|nr:hypothetical protein [Acidobacteriota bacterium]